MQQNVRIVNVFNPEALACALGDVDPDVVLKALSYRPGRWVDTGRTKGGTTAWRWTLRLRWGFVPWPVRYAEGGIVGKRVLRWQWPSRRPMQ